MEHYIDQPAEGDRQAVTDIFNHYVAEGFAAFPEKPLGPEFFDMFRGMAQGYPCVVLRGPRGAVEGFGHLRPYHPLSTFRRSAEVAYFLAPRATGRGLGGLLLGHLCDAAAVLGVDCILACVGAPNQASLKFHLKHGFVECGRFRRVAQKHGRDLDLVWLQKFIAPQEATAG